MSGNQENRAPEKKEREWWEIPARGSVLLLLLILIIPDKWYRAAYHYTIGRFFRHTVESRLEDFGEKVHKQLKLQKLPEKLIIVVLKQEKRLELWGEDSGGNRTLIKTLPVIAVNRNTGTKLKEGDTMTPEGDYAIESLHPNSFFYLALRINYPSREDKKMAEADGRAIDSLGTDIMLHGTGGSSGCIAVPNRSMEEIFYLTAHAGVKNTRILICPKDFRQYPVPEKTDPPWLLERYRHLARELKTMPLPER